MDLPFMYGWEGGERGPLDQVLFLADHIAKRDASLPLCSRQKVLDDLVVLGPISVPCEVLWLGDKAFGLVFGGVADQLEIFSKCIGSEFSRRWVLSLCPLALDP